VFIVFIKLGLDITRQRLQEEFSRIRLLSSYEKEDNCKFEGSFQMWKKFFGRFCYFGNVEVML